jgi:hypothetical protein
VRPHLAEATCCVVPIRAGRRDAPQDSRRVGDGQGNRVNHDWCEGWDARHGENILIADDPSALPRPSARSSEFKLREKLQVNARSTAVETYAWTLVGARMRAAYWGLLRNN